MTEQNFLSPINTKFLNNFDKIMDVVVSDSETNLIKHAKENNMPYVSGLYMTFFQATEQYKIYTKYDAPTSHMLNAYNKKI